MKRWKGSLEVVALCVAIIASLFISSHVLNHQFSSDELRVRAFYKEPENSLDMVLIGSSAAYTTFSSTVAWKEEGFTSYTLATSGAPMGIAKSMLKEVVKTQKPKLILIDLNGVLYDDEAEQREGMTRLWVDNMPLSENKLETLDELTQGKDKLSWLFPLITYHQNWEKIKVCLRYTGYDWKLWTGSRLPYSFTMRSISGTSDRKNLIDVTQYQEKQELYPLSGQRFRELLDYLKENDMTNVAFFNMPRYYDKKMLPQRKLLNQAIAMAEAEGFQVYDFDREIARMNLDPNKDYYNSGHLNMNGQRKATKYIAKRLNQDHHLSDGGHSEAIRDLWDQEYEAYEKVYAYHQENLKKGIREEITAEVIDRVLSKSEEDSK